MKLKRYLAMIIALTQLCCIDIVHADSIEVVSSDIITDESGDLLLFAPEGYSNKKETIRNSIGLMTMGENEYPSSYNNDIDNLKYSLYPENQGIRGTCWAFATNALIGSVYMKLLNATEGEADMSEEHMVASVNGTSDFGYVVPSGSESGNGLRAVSYYTRNKDADNLIYGGPIRESQLEDTMPYSVVKPDTSGYNLDYERDLYPMNYSVKYYVHLSTTGSNKMVSNNLTKSEKIERNNMIKRWLLNNGAVNATIYAGGSLSDSTKGFATGPNDETIFYQNDLETTPNHLVCIVGYDDDYSKDNFSAYSDINSSEDDYHYAATPTIDGAFIVKNSWGDKWGTGGYFYMSYDSNISILETISDVREMSDAEVKPFDNIYDYTPFFYSKIRGLSLNDDASAYGINVYDVEKKDNSHEVITHIGTSIPEANTYLTAVVDKNADSSSIEGNQPFTDLEIVSLVSTSDEVEALGNRLLVKTPGYYVFQLKEPIVVTGDKFSAGFLYSCSNETVPCIPYAVTESGIMNMSGNANTSYVSKDGKIFYDTYDSDSSNSFGKFGILDSKAYTKNEDNIYVVKIHYDSSDKYVNYDITYSNDKPVSDILVEASINDYSNYTFYYKENDKYYECNFDDIITGDTDIYSENYIKAIYDVDEIEVSAREESSTETSTEESSTTSTEESSIEDSSEQSTEVTSENESEESTESESLTEQVSETMTEQTSKEQDSNESSESSSEYMSETESETSTETITIDENTSENTSEQISESQTESETEAELENNTEIESETESSKEPESKIDTEPESNTETESSTEKESELSTEIEIETESSTETELEIKSSTEAESNTEIESETSTESESESKTEISTESKSSTETEMSTETSTEPESESSTELETIEISTVSTKLQSNWIIDDGTVIRKDYNDDWEWKDIGFAGNALAVMYDRGVHVPSVQNLPDEGYFVHYIVKNAVRAVTNPRTMGTYKVIAIVRPYNGYDEVPTDKAIHECSYRITNFNPSECKTISDIMVSESENNTSNNGNVLLLSDNLIVNGNGVSIITVDSSDNQVETTKDDIKYIISALK